MHPAIYEALILGLMGSSGVGAGLLLGIRQAIPLAIVALGATTVLRVWTAFAVWSFGVPSWNLEVWLVGSAVLVLGGIATHWRLWRVGVAALGIFAGLSVTSLSTKYLLDIGERHHSDISKVLGVALVVVQGDLDDLSQAAGSYKRGIAYPLMLALGPEGRILGGFTPLVFLMTLLLAGWLARQILPWTVSNRVLGIVALGLGLFSITVPMFRAAMFYLNGHTLMGFSVLLVVSGLVLTKKERRFGYLPTAFALTGGVIGVTARIEGVVLILVVMIALVAQQSWTKAADRLRLFAVLGLSGVSLTWWLTSLSSPVPERLNLPENSLLMLIGLSIVGAAVAASSFFDIARPVLLPALALVLLFVLGRQVLLANDPVGLVLAQWPNLALGAGGWGTAAHVFIGSVVLLSLQRRSSKYLTLLYVVWMLIGAILFTKTFDGGSFGGVGFYDSVNRMWLHVMPTVLLLSLVGYSEALGRLLRVRKEAMARAEPVGAGSLSAH